MRMNDFTQTFNTEVDDTKFIYLEDLEYIPAYVLNVRNPGEYYEHYKVILQTRNGLNRKHYYFNPLVEGGYVNYLYKNSYSDLITGFLKGNSSNSIKIELKRKDQSFKITTHRFLMTEGTSLGNEILFCIGVRNNLPLEGKNLYKGRVVKQQEDSFWHEFTNTDELVLFVNSKLYTKDMYTNFISRMTKELILPLMEIGIEIQTISYEKMQEKMFKVYEPQIEISDFKEYLEFFNYDNLMVKFFEMTKYDIRLDMGGEEVPEEDNLELLF